MVSIDLSLIAFYTVVPNKAPMPAVIAIARAPQNVTRTIPIRMGAPPVRAARAPSSARENKEAADTRSNRLVAGAITTMSKGSAAPTVNVAAEVSAA